MEPNKYSRSKIFRIVSNVSNKEYIGTTIQSLAERMSDFKKQNRKLPKVLSDMFEEDGIENCSIILIENYPCNNVEELNMRERYWIEQRDCINKRVVKTAYGYMK